MIENNMSYEGFKEYFREQLKNTLQKCNGAVGRFTLGK